MTDRHALTFLVNAVWQVPVVAAATFAACRMMRSAPAHYRHALCVLGLIAAVLLPVAGARRLAPERATMPIVQHLEVAAGAVPTASPGAGSPTPARSLPVPRSAADAALWALGLFLAYRLTRLGRAAARTAAICRGSIPNTRPCDVWDRCRRAFGLGRAELRWSAAVDGPVAAGRMVILPESMADAPPEILEAAIGHEAAHLARHDFAVGIACELFAIPVSFHPGASWLLRQLARSREEACDELVTERLLGRDAYARSLVRIAESLSGLASPGYTLGVADGVDLEERVRRLLAPRRRSARLTIAAAVAMLAVCVAIASGLAISARAQTPAQVEMRAAAAAYNSGRFNDAVARFEKAVELEPANLNARLFLAHTYLRQKATDQATAQYREVLRRDARNATAAFAIVSLNGAKGRGESRSLMMEVVKADPKNKAAYYSLGVLAWADAYPVVMKANGGPGPDMYRQIADPALRAKARAEALPAIEEGFRTLQIALAIDPGWSDPMAYLNLLARLRAAIVDDAAESARLIAQADEWVGKALKARKERPDQDKRTDRIDVDGPPPLPIPSVLPPPPPPPPPPDKGVRLVPPPPPPPPPPPRK